MLSSIVSFITSFWQHMVPYVVIFQYQRGVLYSWGKYRRTLEPGFHWKMPVKQSYEVSSVTITTLRLPSQSLTTADNKKMTVGLIGKYRIADVAEYYNNVTDATDTMTDVILGSACSITLTTNLDALGDLAEMVYADVVDELADWGIDLVRIGGTDFQESRTIRLIHDYGVQPAN
jgi:regulator of protease activity HflC (stomatin/prohibitin superfamily)